MHTTETTPQTRRMSAERLAYLTEYFVSGNSTLIGVNERTANELLQALRTERTIVERVEAVLNDPEYSDGIDGDVVTAIRAVLQQEKQ